MSETARKVIDRLEDLVARLERGEDAGLNHTTWLFTDTNCPMCGQPVPTCGRLSRYGKGFCVECRKVVELKEVDDE